MGWWPQAEERLLADTALNVAEGLLLTDSHTHRLKSTISFIIITIIMPHSQPLWSSGTSHQVKLVVTRWSNIWQAILWNLPFNLCTGLKLLKTVFLSFCLSVFLSLCLSVFLSFCPSFFLSFCLSVIIGQRSSKSTFGANNRWHAPELKKILSLARHSKGRRQGAGQESNDNISTTTATRTTTTRTATRTTTNSTSPTWCELRNWTGEYRGGIGWKRHLPSLQACSHYYDQSNNQTW